MITFDHGRAFTHLQEASCGNMWPEAAAPRPALRSQCPSRRVIKMVFFMFAALVASHGPAGYTSAHAAQVAQNTPSKLNKADILNTESIDADISTHSIAITSGFSGTKIIIFGAINRPEGGADNTYDVIVSVSGQNLPIIARHKSNVLGVWVNKHAMHFNRAPSYYTIAMTRPLSKITSAQVLARNGIGFDNLPIHETPGSISSNDTASIDDYKKAIVHLKKKAKLYQEQIGGVTFIGRSLFHSSFDLPGNVPVGPLEARIYLVRDGKIVARRSVDVELRRQGLQRILYDLAFENSFLYGALAVVFAVVAGLSASAVFGRKRA